MAQLIDYNHVRLDLYRAAGFTECEPYPESEIPPNFDSRWVSMRRALTADAH